MFGGHRKFITGRGQGCPTEPNLPETQHLNTHTHLHSTHTQNTPTTRHIQKPRYPPTRQQPVHASHRLHAHLHTRRAYKPTLCPTHTTHIQRATALRIGSHSPDTQKCPFTRTHAHPTHTQCMTPHSHTCKNAHTRQRLRLSTVQPAQPEVSSHSCTRLPHKRSVSTPHLSRQRGTSVQLIPAPPPPPAPAKRFPLGVQRPQWPGSKMQPGGAARVSTASPGAHGARRRRRPARPEPGGRRAEEQVLEA